MPEVESHAHPCHFRLDRSIDRGWGEAAFRYVWDSTSGVKEEGGDCPDLAYCSLYEITTYWNNPGRYEERWFYPTDPPFVGWKFRNPTDGRINLVGQECFSAMLGSAWDRHKIGGVFTIPSEMMRYQIVAWQQYWFQCVLCNEEFPLTEPHAILRAFEPGQNGNWHYTLTKHNRTVWMDWNAQGYVDDSLHLGFSPVFG